MINPSSTTLPIPASAGIGLRAPYFQEILTHLPAIPWFEVHSENYFSEGGLALASLEQIRQHYPLSLHTVGLSLGSSDPINEDHLKKLKRLIARIQPGLVSEHLCWSSVSGYFLNDLLPLPYTQEVLTHFCERVTYVQDYLGRQILLENISSYLQFKDSDMPEWEFLVALAQRTGCGILLDVNNIYVNATNHGLDALGYIDAIPPELVKEIHLAGFTRKHLATGDLLIDTHDNLVATEVWELYRHAVAKFGQVPTLVEWDSHFPPLTVLLEEAARATAILEMHNAVAV